MIYGCLLSASAASKHIKFIRVWHAFVYSIFSPAAAFNPISLIAFIPAYAYA